MLEPFMYPTSFPRPLGRGEEERRAPGDEVVLHHPDHEWSRNLFFRQITGGNVTHFIHCEELGLVALIDMNGDLYYYEFDALGQELKCKLTLFIDRGLFSLMSYLSKIMPLMRILKYFRNQFYTQFPLTLISRDLNFAIWQKSRVKGMKFREKFPYADQHLNFS